MTIHITQGPTLANPDAFDSVPELRRELHRANKALLDYSAALEQRDAVGRNFAGLINRVLMQHIVGDFRGVAAILDAQLEASPRLRESLEDVRESMEIQQTEQWRKAAEGENKSEQVPPYNAGDFNPWAMKTADELRRALDAANRAGIHAMAEIEGFKRLVDDLSKEVSVIVLAHIQGDQDAVSRAVSEFCKKHVVDKRNGSHGIH